MSVAIISPPALRRLCIAAGCAAAFGLAHADDSTQVQGGVGAHAAGNIALNVAAGRGNAQVNSAALAPAGLAATAIGQFTTSAAGTDGALRSSIASGAFEGAHGVVALNQVSGAGNSQVNVALFGASTQIHIVAAGSLAAAVPSPGPDNGPAPTAERSARIDPGAFRGAGGVVQVNQTAGLGNTTGNAFMLQAPGLPSSNSRSIP